MSTCTVNGREHVLEPGETLERLLERVGLHRIGEDGELLYYML